MAWPFCPTPAFIGISVYLLIAPHDDRRSAGGQRWHGPRDLRGTVEIAGLALLLAAVLLDGHSASTRALTGDAPGAASRERQAPRRWEATVYLPLADNQGRPFAEADWQAALERLVVPFGGATLGQPLEGCWLDDRRRMCREPVRPVVVSFAHGRLEEFRRVVHHVGQHLGQEAMYVRFEEPHVQLIPVCETSRTSSPQ